MTTENKQDRVLRAALLAAGDVVYEWDLTTDQIEWVGPVFEFFGTDKVDPYSVGEKYHGRINPEDLPFRLKLLSDHYLNRDAFDCEYRVRRADGRMCWVHDRGFADFDKDDQPVRMRGLLRLIDDRKQNEARLEHLANFDELTGHLNRSRLRDAMHHAMAHSIRYQTDGAFLCVGLDKLSLINDAYGYLAADAVIVGAGQRLEKAVRECDTIGRVGGDVYGLILGQCPESELSKVADKILRMFREQPIQTPVGPIHVSVSIGGVAFPSYVQTPAEAMTRAEAALREAKGQGRDCHRFYHLTDAQRSEHRRDIVLGKQVKEALKDGRLTLAYQPVVGAGTGAVAFYECLLRMRAEDGSLVAAGDFIPVVERLGLSRMIDRHVLELGVQQLAEDPEVCLALNISGLTASDQSWLRRLISLVGGRPEIASRLTVEITETAAIEDIEESARFVDTVRDLGCRVALDDFGAGYTSFRHLKALSVDVVKIDGSFVRDIATNRDNRLFVRTLVGLAKGFGLETVAECVEDKISADILAQEGADYLQGYYFARPELERCWAHQAVIAPPPETKAKPVRAKLAANPTPQPRAIGGVG